MTNRERNKQATYIYKYTWNTNISIVKEAKGENERKTKIELLLMLRDTRNYQEYYNFFSNFEIIIVLIRISSQKTNLLMLKLHLSFRRSLASKIKIRIRPFSPPPKCGADFKTELQWRRRPSNSKKPQDSLLARLRKAKSNN